MSDVTELPETELQEFSVICIRLKDGTLIDPLTRELVNQGSPVDTAPVAPTSRSKKNDEPSEEDLEALDAEIETLAAEYAVDQAFEVVPLSRRSLHDITLPANQMAVICMDIMYKNWGLPDDEIALSIGVSAAALDHVRNLDMYGRLNTDLIQSVRNAYMGTVEGIIQQASTKAALRMVKFVGGMDGDHALAASKDILDRSGHRPADKLEVNMNVAQDLVIRVIRERDEDKHFSSIDLSAN